MIARQDWALIAAAAIAITLLNGWKPVVVDDTAYLLVAEQIAHHPDDPYGFDLFWRDAPEPANQVLAPPVLPYWIAASMILFGGHLILWKLALFPFAFALALAIHLLSTRLAPGRERLALGLVLALPGVLAGFNLMTDVPALALGLLGLALALHAIERQRIGAALLAGLLAGVAMQTKYTSVAPLAVAALHGLLCRQPRIVASMLAAAGVVFVGWELFIHVLYGQSHLGAGLSAPATGDARSFSATFLGLVCLLGASSPALGLLSLAGLRARMGVLVGAGLSICIGILAIALLPAPPHTAAYLPGGRLVIGPEGLPFLGLGLFGIASFGLLARSMLRTPRDPARAPAERALDLLALSWVVVELTLLFALAPYRFLAARRLLGLSVAVTIFAARALSISSATSAGTSESSRSRLILGVAAFVGLLFCTSDFSDAAARRNAVTSSAEKLAELGAHPTRETVWYTGHWAFQYYATRRGYKPVVPLTSQLTKGDWLLVPLGVSHQALPLNREDITAVAEIHESSPWPWSTIPGAYIGMIPMRRQPETQVVVRIYRVQRDFVAQGRAAPEAATPAGRDRYSM